MTLGKTKHGGWDYVRLASTMIDEDASKSADIGIGSDASRSGGVHVILDIPSRSYDAGPWLVEPVRARMIAAMLIAAADEAERAEARKGIAKVMP